MNLRQNIQDPGMLGSKRQPSRAVLLTTIQPGRGVETTMEDISTEKDLQLQELVKKQLDTKVTLQSQLCKRKHFTSGSAFKELSEEVSGAQDHLVYKNILDREARVEELKSCGLNQDEITFMLTHEGFSIPEFASKKKRKFELKQSLTLENINEKIEMAKKRLKKPDKFAGAKVMTRHEMDLEKSISHNKDKELMLGCLITEVRESPLSGDPENPLNHLDSILEEALVSHRNSSNMHEKNIKSIPSGTEATKSSDLYGQDDEEVMLEEHSEMLEPMPEQGCAPKPKIPEIIVDLPEIEIIKNRLTVEEIRKQEKFKSYHQGELSQVLYIKNLSRRVNEADLMSLFNRFEKDNVKIKYKLMTGKMRGQAFVTFDSIETAQKALNLTNGYILKEKPLIIQFGRK